MHAARPPLAQSLPETPGPDPEQTGPLHGQWFAWPGLIDEYVLHVHPVAIGAGKPLFTQKTSLKLVSTRTYDCGIMQLRYQAARPAAGPLPAGA